MSLTGAKSKAVYFAETVFLYLLSAAAIHCALLLSAKAGLFDSSNRMFGLWRLNPYLTIPYLSATFLGMVTVPLVWERAVRKVGFTTIGFAAPRNFARESANAAILFFLFVVYPYIFSSARNKFMELSYPTMMSLAGCWLFVALSEEVLYRGIIQRRLCNLSGKYSGLIFASIVFAFVGHCKAPVMDNLILRLPFGLILGYIYLRTRSLVLPVAMHWGFNVLFASY